MAACYATRDLPLHQALCYTGVSKRDHDAIIAAVPKPLSLDTTKQAYRCAPGFLNMADLTNDCVASLPLLWQGKSKHACLKGLFSPKDVIGFVTVAVRLMIFFVGVQEPMQNSSKQLSFRAKIEKLKTSREKVSLKSFYELTLLKRPGVLLLFATLIVDTAFASSCVNKLSIPDKFLKSRHCWAFVRSDQARLDPLEGLHILR